MSRRPRPRRGSRRLPRPRPGPVILAVIVLLGLLGLISYRGPGPAAPRGAATTVVLQRGDGLNEIAQTLRTSGVIGSAGVFTLAARLTGSASDLKAGEYVFASRTPMARMLADIRAGKVVRHMVTIPEGWTSAMAAAAVNRQPVLTGLASPPPEGAVLPDTYQVERGDDRGAVIARMVEARRRLLDRLWAARQPGLPILSPEEAVILASIVERETGVASERPRVAAVFVNRLRAGMRLESDPTVIYGVAQGRPLGRGLTAAELARVTPYNTYQVDGLPPTPIANPGKASIEAVLNPPKTGELFFVADGTGGHVFARTYPEHLANVARWRRIERTRAAAQAPGA